MNHDGNDRHFCLHGDVKRTFFKSAKQAAILEAEARLEAAKRDASATVNLAEASAEAIRRVTIAIGNNETPMLYMLGEKYVSAIQRLGESANAKVVLLPGDLQEAIKGMLRRPG